MVVIILVKSLGKITRFARNDKSFEMKIVNKGAILMYVILVYDIVTDTEGKKILPKVFKICKKYLVHIQKSVFEGEISNANIIALKHELSEYIRDDTDSVIIFKARQEKWLQKEFWGLEDDKMSKFI